jgi:hypothetical protein
VFKVANNHCQQEKYQSGDLSPHSIKAKLELRKATMQRLPVGPLYYEFSRHNEPRLRIQPGETVLVESEDAFSGQIRTNDDRRDKTKKPYGNPQTGPI